MAYLNLDPDYFSHPKTTRLVAFLGNGAAELPIRLWAYAAKHHAANGRLDNYTAEEIKSCIGWWGDGDKMIEGLLRFFFLKKCRSGYEINGWKEHEGHLEAFKKRAKLANKARWDKYYKHSNKKRPRRPEAPLDGSPLPNHTIPSLTIKKRIGKPESLEAVKTFFKDDVTAQDFWDFYESKGWIVGKAPMRDWTAAARRWARNNAPRALKPLKQALKKCFVCDKEVDPDLFMNHMEQHKRDRNKTEGTVITTMVTDIARTKGVA